VHTTNRVAGMAARVLSAEHWARGVSRDEFIDAAGARGGREGLADWILGLLELRGRLQREQDRWQATIPLGDERPLPEGAQDDFKELDATMRIVDRIAEGGSDVLCGARTGEEVLFGRETFALWFRYFHNSNLLYAPNNRLAALALADRLPSGARILELGGGTGSAGEALAEEVAGREQPPWPAGYCFTELAPAFERRGSRVVRARWPDTVDVSSAIVDFDRSLVEQGLEAGSFDAVWAVNALHASQDLGASLSRVLEVIRPGGLLVLGECVRPRPGEPIYTEFLFAFLESYRSVPLGPLRSTPGFLTVGEWRDNLAVAGFAEISIVPDVEAIQQIFPEFVAAAIVARRPT
jgi:SAM-dependent methyltransferase